MPKNYYIILGIPSDSSQTDIKAAYRRLAKEFHPDHFGESQIPFQVLQEAYSVLSDPKSRKTYDDSLQKTGRQSQRAEPARRDFRPHSNRYPGRYSAQIIESLVPDEALRSFTRRSPENSFHHYRSVFDSIFDQFFGGFQEYQQPVSSKSADYLRLWVRF